MLITVDGFCSQGKSTIGRALAEALGLEFFSIGTLFRYLAARLCEMDLPAAQREGGLQAALEELRRLPEEALGRHPHLRSAETESMLKTVASFGYVHDAVAEKIRAYAQGKALLLDGRFGFLVFPEASCSFYCISAFDRRVGFAAASRRISRQEAEAYIRFRDSFEVRYTLPERVLVMDMNGFPDVPSAVACFRQEVEKCK